MGISENKSAPDCAIDYFGECSAASPLTSSRWDPRKKAVDGPRVKDRSRRPDGQWAIGAKALLRNDRLEDHLLFFVGLDLPRNARTCTQEHSSRTQFVKIRPGWQDVNKCHLACLCPYANFVFFRRLLVKHSSMQYRIEQQF